MKKIKIIESTKGGEWFRELPQAELRDDTNKQEMNLLQIYSDIKYQAVKGFGGAFTPASAYNYSLMPNEIKAQFMDYCFSESGLNYNIGRVPIGSCDFATENYTYCDTQRDVSLKTFSIEKDKELLIPFIKEAMEKKGVDIPLMASPWTPPAWMKDNNSLLGGGSLKEEYYTAYANYLVKYVKTYRELGIDIQWLTVQNEEIATQTWESCTYTPQQDIVFLRDHLLPTLRKSGLGDVKVFIWDHNKERVYIHAKILFADEYLYENIAGLAFHWYSGDHFGNLRLFKDAFPHKDLFFTEGCVELSGATSMSAKATKTVGENKDEPVWDFGECYGHDIIGNFNGGMNGFIDWNLLLDEIGGPNHVKNYCSAPILYNNAEKQIHLQPAYCFISHFSRYVPVGSKVTAHSSYISDLEVCSFVTPDSQNIVVVLNANDFETPYSLSDVCTDSLVDLVAPPRSIATIIY